MRRRARKTAPAATRQQPLGTENGVEAATAVENSSENNKLPTVPTDGEQVEGYDKSVLDVLAEGVHNSWSLLHSAVVEFLACKDEILKHTLPPALLLRIVVSTTKIFRSFSDANTPVLELLRLVKLYSADWEQQSATLKKLHADNESKQRQLNIALRRIEMTAMEQQRMAKERRVMNWERLYAKLHNKQSHGRRWKFTMQAFKDKLRDGKLNPGSYGPTHSDSDNDERGGERQSIASGRAGSRGRLRLSSREGSLGVSGISLDHTNISDEEGEEQEDAEKAEESGGDSDGVQTPGLASSPAQSRTSVGDSKPAGHVQSAMSGLHEASETTLSVEDSSAWLDKSTSAASALEQEQQRNRQPSQAQLLSHSSRGPERDGRSHGSNATVASSDAALSYPLPPPVETRDVAVATHEEQFRRCLGMRVYPPKDVKGVPKVALTLSLGSQIHDTEIFETVPPTATPGSATPQYEVVTFQLPIGARRATPSSSAVSLSTEEQDTSEADSKLNIILHAKSAQGPIIGMTTIQLEDLLGDSPEFIVNQKDGEEPGCDESEGTADGSQEQLQSKSASSVLSASDIVNLNKRLPTEFELRPLAGGTDSVFSIVAYQMLTFIPPTQTKASNTVSIEELLMGMAENLGFLSMDKVKGLVEEKEEEIHALYRANNAIKQGEADQAIESHMKDLNRQAMEHASEIVRIQQRFEESIEKLADSLRNAEYELTTVKEDNRGAVVTATDDGSSVVELTESQPALTDMQATIKAKRSLSVRFVEPDKPMRRRYDKATHPMPADWMENFPDDFLERLALFNTESRKRQQQMVAEVTKQVTTILTQQMAAQHRLARQKKDDADDICLPALFVPANRPGVIYNPRAKSYFHPFGTGCERVSQPPSILKLPALPQRPQPALSTVNLFNLSQQFVSDGPYWWKSKQGGGIPMPGLASSNPPPSMTHIQWRAGSSSSSTGRGGSSPQPKDRSTPARRRSAGSAAGAVTHTPAAASGDTPQEAQDKLGRIATP